MWVDGILTGAIIALSAIPIAAWDQLKDNRAFWGVIIVVSQLLQIAKNLLPASKRLAGLKHLIPEMRLLAIDAQYAYEKHKSASDDEILEIIAKYKRRHTELDSKYLGDDCLPSNEKIQDKACTQCDQYMELYGYKSTKEDNEDARQDTKDTPASATA